jgi:hypothetical protein
MLRCVVLVITDVSEELSASIIRVTRLCELGTTLAVTSNRRTLGRSTSRLLVMANVVPSSPILVTLMMVALSFPKTAVLTRATRCNPRRRHSSMQFPFISPLEPLLCVAIPPWLPIRSMVLCDPVYELTSSQRPPSMSPSSGTWRLVVSVFGGRYRLHLKCRKTSADQSTNPVHLLHVGFWLHWFLTIKLEVISFLRNVGSLRDATSQKLATFIHKPNHQMRK